MSKRLWRTYSHLNKIRFHSIFSTHCIRHAGASNTPFQLSKFPRWSICNQVWWKPVLIWLPSILNCYRSRLNLFRLKGDIWHYRRGHSVHCQHGIIDATQFERLVKASLVRTLQPVWVKMTYQPNGTCFLDPSIQQLENPCLYFTESLVLNMSLSCLFCEFMRLKMVGNLRLQQKTYKIFFVVLHCA